MALGNFKLENLPRKVQMAIIAFLALGLVAAGYFFYLQDMVNNRSALLAEVERLEKAVSQASDVEQRLEQFKRDVALLDARLEELRRILPAQKETPEVMRAVQNMAADSTLKIVKFAPQAVVPKAFYSDWPIAMDIQGSYNALGTFVEKIGQFRRIVNVDNLVVKILEGSTDPGRTLSASFTATTFVYREDQVSVPVR
jgi:type IV pilus assembly protein PilO